MTYFLVGQAGTGTGVGTGSGVGVGFGAGVGVGVWRERQESGSRLSNDRELRLIEGKARGVTGFSIIPSVSMGTTGAVLGAP